jgi:hypothetical protein
MRQAKADTIWELSDMLKRTAIALVFVMIAGMSNAAVMEMNCKNPRRDYLAVFDDKANTFKLKTSGTVTTYMVMRIDNTGGKLIVTGKSVIGGPDFVAYLDNDRRIEFIVDGKTIQTDRCK